MKHFQKAFFALLLSGMFLFQPVFGQYLTVEETKAKAAKLSTEDLHEAYNNNYDSYYRNLDTFNTADDRSKVSLRESIEVFDQSLTIIGQELLSRGEVPRSSKNNNTLTKDLIDSNALIRAHEMKQLKGGTSVAGTSSSSSQTSSTSTPKPQTTPKEPEDPSKPTPKPEPKPASKDTISKEDGQKLIDAAKKTNQKTKAYSEAVKKYTDALADPNTSPEDLKKLADDAKKAEKEFNEAVENEKNINDQINKKTPAQKEAPKTEPVDEPSKAPSSATEDVEEEGKLDINQLFPTWNDEKDNIDGVIGENEDKKFFMNYIPRIIDIFLKFVSPMILIVLIVAGARMIIAGDDSEQVEKAKKVIIYSVIGVVLILLSYSIMRAVYFFFVG